MDNKVAVGETRRTVLHDTMKSQVDRDVNADIAERAEHATRSEGQRMDQVAEKFRGKAIDEVVGTDREAGRARSLTRIAQVVDYVFSALYTVLAIRLVLALIGAYSANGFVQFITAITNPFYAMFRGIVASPSAEGFTLALPIIIAIIAYFVLHMGIRALLRLIAHRKTEI
jgi:uncharacterized protein YggT (Ycf19 family)